MDKSTLRKGDKLAMHCISPLLASEISICLYATGTSVYDGSNWKVYSEEAKASTVTTGEEAKAATTTAGNGESALDVTKSDTDQKGFEWPPGRTPVMLIHEFYPKASFIVHDVQKIDGYIFISYLTIDGVSFEGCATTKKVAKMNAAVAALNHLKDKGLLQQQIACKGYKKASIVAAESSKKKKLPLPPLYEFRVLVLKCFKDFFPVAVFHRRFF